MEHRIYRLLGSLLLLAIGIVRPIVGASRPTPDLATEQELRSNLERIFRREVVASNEKSATAKPMALVLIEVYWSRNQDGVLKVKGTDEKRKAIVREVSENGRQYVPVIDKLITEAWQSDDPGRIPRYANLLGEVIASIPARMVLAKTYLLIHETLADIPLFLNESERFSRLVESLNINPQKKPESLKRVLTWAALRRIEGECLKYVAPLKSQRVLESTLETLSVVIDPKEFLTPEPADEVSADDVEAVNKVVFSAHAFRIYRALDYLAKAYNDDPVVLKRIQEIRADPESALSVVGKDGPAIDIAVDRALEAFE